MPQVFYTLVRAARDTYLQGLDALVSNVEN